VAVKCLLAGKETRTMGFTIITTISPEFTRAERDFFPTWHANSGADSIVVHKIDEGSWPENILKRAEIFRDELIARMRRGENVLLLDADCIVLRDLSGGFSDKHSISVARWPQVNMWVAFFNLARPPVPIPWKALLRSVAGEIATKVAAGHTASHECDQVVWRPHLHRIEGYVLRLAEWEWNYNCFDLPQWQRELPKLKEITRVIHIKGHGDWEYAQLDAKLDYARALWPKELACIA
jgi:hypothetical protein